MMSEVPRLTRTEADALTRIRDHGSSWWCYGHSRSGGAVARMFRRMADLGLCTKAPYIITDKGLAVLRERAKERP